MGRRDDLPRGGCFGDRPTLSGRDTVGARECVPSGCTCGASNRRQSRLSPAGVSIDFVVRRCDARRSFAIHARRYDPSPVTPRPAGAERITERKFSSRNGEIASNDRLVSFTSGGPNAAEKIFLAPAGTPNRPDHCRPRSALLRAFASNALIASGDDCSALRVVEVGTACDPSVIAISADSETFIELGQQKFYLTQRRDDP